MNNNNNNFRELKIGLFGCTGVGKSSITFRILDGIFVDEYDPTIVDEYQKEIDLNDEKIILNILDTASCEDHFFAIEKWANFAQLFILVYSITDKSSFLEILDYHKYIKKYKKENYPKILIGNKSDLFTKRQVKIEKGKELAKKLNCKYIETSAKTGENVYQLFYEATLCGIEELKNQNQNQKKKNGKCLLM